MTNEQPTSEARLTAAAVDEAIADMHHYHGSTLLMGAVSAPRRDRIIALLQEGLKAKQQLAEAQSACEVVRKERDEASRIAMTANEQAVCYMRERDEARALLARQAVPEAVGKLREEVVKNILLPPTREKAKAALDELCRLAAPGAALREALEFYANRKTWRGDDPPIRYDVDGDMAAVPGLRARKALEAAPGEGREVGAPERTRVVKNAEGGEDVYVFSQQTPDRFLMVNEDDGLFYVLFSDRSIGMSESMSLPSENPPAPQPVERIIDPAYEGSRWRDPSAEAKKQAIRDAVAQPVERRDVLQQLREWHEQRIKNTEPVQGFYGIVHGARECVEEHRASIEEIDRLAAGTAPLDTKANWESHTFGIDGIPQSRCLFCNVVYKEAHLMPCSKKPAAAASEPAVLQCPKGYACPTPIDCSSMRGSKFFGDDACAHPELTLPEALRKKPAAAAASDEGVAPSDGECAMCGARTQRHAADPGLWPLWFVPVDAKGHAFGASKPHHVECVQNAIRGAAPKQGRAGLLRLRAWCVAEADNSFRIQQREDNDDMSRHYWNGALSVTSRLREEIDRLLSEGRGEGEVANLTLDVGGSLVGVGNGNDIGDPGKVNEHLRRLREAVVRIAKAVEAKP